MTPTTGPSPIEAAKAKHRLADVVRRTGIPVDPSLRRVITVRCPMPAHGHFDRTPSMRLDLAADRWWCFGCSPIGRNGTPQAGDVIDWVQKLETVDWRNAVRLLDTGRPLQNAWSGLGSLSNPAVSHGETELPRLDRTPPDRVRKALGFAWALYTQRSLHERGLAYLLNRGIDVTVLEQFNHRVEVGHTLDRRDGLVRAMTARGFTEDELVDAGLAQRRTGTPTSDFLRNRVIIPVRDGASHVCGLIGRNVGDSRYPKYKNPPRTSTYDKSINLYQPLPSPASPSSRMIIVEGTIDAMAVAVAAIKAGPAAALCPVTQSGRVLSTRQLSYVLASSPRPPIVAFDGDEPGRQSNQRLLEAAEALNRTVTIAYLPDGEDPASLVSSRGVEAIALLSPRTRPTTTRVATATGPYSAPPAPETRRTGVSI